MLKSFAALCFLTAVAGAAPTVPAFDLVNVSVTAPAPWYFPAMAGGITRAGVDIRNATMLDLIRTAWGVDPDYVVGGPNWLDLDRFDVLAKAPPDTRPDTMHLMLRSLLSNRFNLRVHSDKRPLPTFVLAAGQQPRLKEADGSGADGCRYTRPGPGETQSNTSMTCRNVSMEEFAANIPAFVGNAYINHPVKDQTGLTGKWDFTISWTAHQLLDTTGAEGMTFFDAIDRKLGLKLALQNVPTDVIVVDRVERTIPARPGSGSAAPEFEVADVKPSDPDATTAGGGIQPGGRFDLSRATIRQLIRFAWTITSDDMIANAPKWIDGQRFDVVAKAPDSGQGTPDFNTVRLMMRALLKDRFQLATHMETRQVTAYAMMTDKPRLKPADPATRIGCKRTVETAGSGANMISAASWTCENTTMAELAARLQPLSYEPGGTNYQLPHPVVDATGLAGGWNFVLTWSTGAMPATTDPTGRISIQEALEKQLGLKLELQKRPISVLVIDHVEPRPTEN